MKMVGQIHNKTMSTDSTKKRKKIDKKTNVLDEEALGKKQNREQKTKKQKQRMVDQLHYINHNII